MSHRYPGLELQGHPKIFVGVIPGRWLLTRTTPSWRIDDPEKGFQRRVNQERAREIATAVLNQGRTFPNAIVLATNSLRVTCEDSVISFPDKVKFLVVDGQHRLWAQKFATVEARYCCMIHVGLTEEEMAELFVEINDNQKRVPSSLRWDLVRLVRAEDDPDGVRAVDLIYELNTDRRSPLYQRVDLTGEQREISLKQGSLAPSIKSLLSRRGQPLHDLAYDDQLEILIRFFSAIRERDADGWDNATGPLYKARVIRALLRLLPDIIAAEGKSGSQVSARVYLEYLRLIDLSSLDQEKIRGQQGSAGVRAIYDTLVEQVFEEA